MASTPSSSSVVTDPKPPRSGQQTVAVNIADGSQSSSRRFQLEVSECVETKTVTTTTRLTRKFPHVFARDPTPLESLDTKEYPLAMKPTPPELTEFSYIVNRNGCDDEYEEAGVTGMHTNTPELDIAVDESSLLRPVSSPSLRQITCAPHLHRFPGWITNEVY